MVLTLIFAVVVVLIALVIFRTGRLTTDKMALQNGADAVAYSASVIEARDLNFASYMNRAVVANEVAIGQAIGLASWAYHWKSIGDWILEYDNYLKGPTLGTSSTFLVPAASIFTVSGNVFVPLLSGYAKGMTAINTNVNMAYGIASLIHHVATIVATVGVMNDVIDDNAPDEARMSYFGLMSLIGHLATYHTQFTNSFNPTRYVDVADFQDDTTGETDAGGYGRLAALVRNSGDPFTKGEHNPEYNADPSLNGRGWDFALFEELLNSGFLPFSLPLTVPFPTPVAPNGQLVFSLDAAGNIRLDYSGGLDFSIDASPLFEASAGYDLSMYAFFGIGMERQGSSEIRMVVPLTGTNRDRAAGQQFSWSSADTTRAYFNAGAGFAFDAYADVEVLELVSVSGSGSASADAAIDGKNSGIELSASVVLKLSVSVPLVGKVNLPPIEIEIDICDVSTCPFPAELPIGTGFAQGANSSRALTVAPNHMGTEKLGVGPIPGDAYGRAANTIIPWNYIGINARGIYWQPTFQPQTNVATAYRGLPNYLDTTDMDTTGPEAMYGAGGPFLLTGLTMSQENFQAETYSDPDAEPTGRFELDEEFGSESMSVIAKSEVYFKRPLDLDQFARGDGYVEHGSAFNPYWQARLVETSHADRVAALLIEHQEVAQDGISTIVLQQIAGVVSFLEGILPADANLLP